MGYSLRIGRLAEVCGALIEQYNRKVTVADIGCDHAHLGILLCSAFAREQVQIIASDLRKGPLETADANIARAGFSDRIALRLADGLDKLAPGEADIIVISGMGAEQIRDILEQGIRTARSAGYLVLSPHTKPAYLRWYCDMCGIRRLDECSFFEEPRFYHIMTVSPSDYRIAPDTKAEPASERYTDAQLFGGADARELMEQKRMYEQSLLQLSNGVTEDAKRRAQELKTLLARVERYYHETYDQRDIQQN